MTNKNPYDAVVTPPSQADRDALEQIMEIIKPLCRDGQKRVLMSACAFFDIKMTIE